MSLPVTDKEIRIETQKAIKHFWESRDAQSGKQKASDRPDAGSRSAVTGGKQLDGFIEMIVKFLKAAGVPESSIYLKRGKQVIPGYFRATKQWDLIVVHKGRLILAIETKSQVGSFGNNVNNRAEESVGSAVDFWRAHEGKAFGEKSRPWLGYLFVLQDCGESNEPVSVEEPHFNVFPEFNGASYAKRYELLCRRLAIEKKYDSTALLLSKSSDGNAGDYTQPADDLGIEQFIKAMLGHVIGGLEL